VRPLNFSTAKFGIAIALKLLKEENTMPNETNDPEKTELQDRPTSSQEALQEKLNNIANKAAERAANRQKRYDSEHGIFTR
jgi:hypothetical protein